MASDMSPTPAAAGLRNTVGAVMHPALTTVERGAHLAGAAYLMKHNRESALVVTTGPPETRPLGVLTDADIAQVVADGKNPEEVRIEHLGLREPLTVETAVSVTEAARSMLSHHLDHLPVVDAGRVVGIVDLSDVCRALLREESTALT